MVRAHRLLLTLASGSALYSGMVPALGLGEISLHSALNQPLDAEIELLEVGDLDASDIHVGLASADDFQRSGVARFVFLNDLRFSPVLRGANSVIRVASTRPVREPYLNFLIEVQRPTGRLLREYTVLLDPPGSAYHAQASQAPAQARPERATIPAISAPPAIQGKRYTVAPGDSLWAIARRLQEAGSEASLDELMTGIHALNPQAFSGGDIHRLKAGVTLLLPDTAVETQVVSAGQATAPAAVPQRAEAPTGQPEPAEMARIAALQRRLDEELLASEAEKQRLRDEKAELEARLEQLQRRLNDMDSQLAEVRAGLTRPSANAPVERGEPAAPVEQGTEAVPPKVRQESAAEGGRSFLANGLWISLGGLLLILLGLAWWFLARRPRREEPEEMAAEVVSATPPPEPLEEQSLSSLWRNEPFRPVTARPMVSSDPLEGANLYIAYGRFAEALTVLRAAVNREPTRTDLRYRLLEVLGELGDRAGFASEEAALREQGFSTVKLDQLKARYPLAAAPLDEIPDVLQPVLREAEAEAEPVALESQDDFALNLDDFSLDADWDLDSPFKPAAPKRAQASQPAQPEEVDLNFNSNLQELPELFELTLGPDVLSPFGDTPEAKPFEEDQLSEAFFDAFGDTDAPRETPPVERNLDHLAGSREHLTKLNQALAYIEQGDLGSACAILNEVIIEGDDQERQEARELLAKIA